MVIFPALYSLSSSGSRAGRRGNSKPSTSAQSSAWPSRVTIPGLNWAEIRASSSGSQCQSPDSWWEAANCEQPKTITQSWRRSWSDMSGNDGVLGGYGVWSLLREMEISKKTMEPPKRGPDDCWLVGRYKSNKELVQLLCWDLHGYSPNPKYSRKIFCFT